jgi:hypothetical protein
MRRCLWLGALFWSSTILAQTAPLGPGRPGQKKLPASLPSSRPSTLTPTIPVKPPTQKTPDLPPAVPARIEPATAPTTQASEKKPTKPKDKAPQGWLRLAGRSAQFRPEAVGGAADVFFLRSVLRLGTRVEQWRFAGLVDTESLTLGAAVIGLAYPARVTPFVEAYAGGGLWHQTLFNQELYNQTRIFGVEAGAEVYVSSLFFLFASGGYSEASREVEIFEGVQQERFGGASFRFGFGLAKR